MPILSDAVWGEISSPPIYIFLFYYKGQAMENLSNFCCQNKDCPDYLKINGGNLTVCGRFGKNKHIRLLYCRTCKYRFSERKGTPLFGLRLDDKKMATVFNHISEGCGVRQTSRLVGVHRDTVSRYISAAGDQAQELFREISADTPNNKIILLARMISKAKKTKRPGPKPNSTKSQKAKSQSPEPAEPELTLAEQLFARENQAAPPAQKSTEPEEKDNTTWIPLNIVG